MQRVYSVLRQQRINSRAGFDSSIIDEWNARVRMEVKHIFDTKRAVIVVNKNLAILHKAKSKCRYLCDWAQKGGVFLFSIWLSRKWHCFVLLQASREHRCTLSQRASIHIPCLVRKWRKSPLPGESIHTWHFQGWSQRNILICDRGCRDEIGVSKNNAWFIADNRSLI